MRNQNNVVYFVIIFVAICITILAVYWFSVRQKSLSPSNVGVSQGEQKEQARNKVHYPVVDDCSIDIPTHLIDDNSIDSVSGTVEVRWFDQEKQENVKRTFRYRPNDGFVGCSDSVKSKLEQVYQMEQDRSKELRAQCPYFEAIIKGDVSLPEKGGEQAQMEGAVDFVKQYCK